MGRALAKRAAVHGVEFLARTTSSSTNARRVKLPNSVPGAPPGTKPTPYRGKARYSSSVLLWWGETPMAYMPSGPRHSRIHQLTCEECGQRYETQGPRT